MDEYIDIKIDVFEHTGQHARLRKTLTAADLVDEILKEFDDISADSPGKYALYLQGSDRPLNFNLTLEQLDIQPQDDLIFNYAKQTIRQMLEPQNFASLRDDSGGRVYDIRWQPAIIGRPTNDADHNINLAVNFQLHPKGQTVSRKHAQITFETGRFLIEPLAENNPVAINGEEISFGLRKEIKNGDHILIGRSNLLLIFMTKTVTGVQSIPSQPVASAPENAAAKPKAAFSAPAAAVPVRLMVEQALDTHKIGQQLELTTFPYLLGRDLPLLSGEAEVSRRHGEINFDSDARKYFLTDLNSTNGITLQGIRIEPNRPYEIVPGALIGLGRSLIMRFEA